MIRIVNALGKLNWGKRAYAVFVLCATTAIALPAQTFTTLHSFDRAVDGEDLYARLVQATNGDFYGTTWLGGKDNGGAIFEITPSGTLTTLYNFCSQTNCPDGSLLYAGLVQGTDGNFYGTTSAGGRAVDCDGQIGCGTIFKINSSGTLTTLYTFCPTSPCTDGATPYAALVQGNDGNFYGTTETGGLGLGSGTVFKITPSGTLTTLYQFCSQTNCTDGANPYAALIQGADGNFYGTTKLGGTKNSGTVFKITPSGTLTTLHSFVGTDGADTQSGLVQGTDGNFYGTTNLGGATGEPLCRIGAGCGTVFKITPSGTFTSLYSFCSESGCPDGGAPYAGLIQGTDGNFYGTTESSGANADGTIFKITPAGTLTTLYSFCSQAGCADGSEPYAGLIQASDGNLYGTTYEGGTNNDGTVFKLTLASSTAPPAINQSGGVVNGASFQAGIAPGSWITIKGTNLSSVTDTWANAIVNGDLPTSLDGVSVSVGGVPAYISYVSPAQINAVAPNVGPGTAPVTVSNSNGTSSPMSTVVQTAQPAFFQWGTYAVATTQDYSLAVKNGTFAGVTTVPAQPGEIIILWGTGFGPTSPSAPAGVEAPSSTTYNTATAVTVTVGGMAATVYGAALTSGYAGLYQVAIQIPSSLADGDYPVIATISGVQSPSTTLITVQD